MSASRRLAIFDIDGTLTDTCDVDNECYLQAVASTLGLEPTALDWSQAPHVTDRALFDWLCQQHCRRTPDPGEASATVTRFLELLQRQLAVQPQRFQAIAGARSAFDLLERSGWEVAIATGGWRPSAKLKLQAIGIDTDGLAFSTSSDGYTRREILELAVQMAQVRGDASFHRIVSIGDGLWDVRVAAELGWPFIGIAGGLPARQLRNAGASIVLPDLSDPDALSAALETARVPALVSA